MNGTIEQIFIFELKQRLLTAAVALAKSRTDEACRMVNRMSAELYRHTGEVFSCGQFVKVA